MKYLDILIECHGVESISSEDYSVYAPVALYCNTGETYQATIIWEDKKKEFSIGSWGGISKSITRLVAIGSRFSIPQTWHTLVVYPLRV